MGRLLWERSGARPSINRSGRPSRARPDGCATESREACGMRLRPSCAMPPMVGPCLLEVGSKHHPDRRAPLSRQGNTALAVQFNRKPILLRSIMLAQAMYQGVGGPFVKCSWLPRRADIGIAEPIRRQPRAGRIGVADHGETAPAIRRDAPTVAISHAELRDRLRIAACGGAL